MPGINIVLLDNPEVDVLAHKGALKRSSTEEIAGVAIIICADEDIFT